MAIVPKNDCDFGQTLMPLEKALSELESLATPVSTIETVMLKESLGRVLAQDIVSKINVPPADNSAMDGYALCASDLQQNDKEKKFKISQRICAGEVGEKLEVGTVARIFTGAPIPEGADAVVMQENCNALPDNSIVINNIVSSGTNVRKAGEDIHAGTTILNAGQKLQAQDIGLAASVGVAELKIKRRLKVAVFFTGDELCELGETLKAGQIYNSNRYTLTSLLNSLACEVIDLGNVEDTLSATVKAMKTAAQQADLVMTSGGVSVGEEDHVRNALEQIGHLDMWRVNIKPGKPFAFGQIEEDSKTTAFIGLPGNPVSVFTTFCIFARAYILKKQGATNTRVHSFMVPSNFEVSGKESRNEYLRVRIEMDNMGQSSLHLFPNQSSGVLTSVSWANGFAFIPANTQVKKGDLVEFTPFNEY